MVVKGDERVTSILPDGTLVSILTASGFGSGSGEEVDEDEIEDLEEIEENKIEIEEENTIDDIKVENMENEKYEIVKDEDLEDFPNQPFKMYSESRKNTMIESIKINGIIEPIVVRKTENGKYQILSGHNRRICGRYGRNFKTF